MKWTTEEIEFLKENYPDKGAAFCAEKLGRRYENIIAMARYRGIYRNRKHPVDEGFFDKIDTELKAYLLGFLLADGNICNGRLSIRLGLKDESFLRELSKNFLNGQDLVRLRDPSKTPRFIEGRKIKNLGSAELSISCKQWVEPLAKLKMIPAKSLVLEFPEISESLLPHFVRGYFDGDGCLSRRRHSGAVRYIFNVVSSASFCDTLKTILSANLGVRAYSQQSKSQIHNIAVTGNQQLKILMDWLYKDATFFLPRKHAVYLQLLADIQRIATKPKTSKFKGVHFDKARGLWAASYRLPNKTKFLGRFTTEVAARESFTTFAASQQTTSSQYLALR